MLLEVETFLTARTLPCVGLCSCLAEEHFVEVKGQVTDCGLFGLYRNERDRLWSVIHIPTGHRVFGASRRDDAMWLLEALDGDELDESGPLATTDADAASQRIAKSRLMGLIRHARYLRAKR